MGVPSGVPVNVAAGDFYVGVYDLGIDNPAPFMASMDTSFAGDSYGAINSTAPGSYSFKPEGTWLIRASAGPGRRGRWL